MSENSKENHLSVATKIESVLGCKWSLQMLGLIRAGAHRPGAIQRAIPGLTAKVQSACLSRMVAYGFLERTVFPVVPPHVEYRLSAKGNRFAAILDAIKALQREEDEQDITAAKDHERG